MPTLLYPISFRHDNNIQDITDWCDKQLGIGGHGYFIEKYDWSIFVYSFGWTKLEFKEEWMKDWFILRWGAPCKEQGSF